MKYSINLASRSYVNRRGLYLIYLICGLVLIAALFYNFRYYFELQNQIDTTNARLNELEEKILASQGGDIAGYTAARFDQVLADIKAANSILKRDSFRWTTLLDQLEKVVPGNVRIKSITPDHKKNSVKIEGQAKGLKDMQKFLDNLIKSKRYDDVLLYSQADEKANGVKVGIEFSIELLGALS